MFAYIYDDRSLYDKLRVGVDGVFFLQIKLDYTINSQRFTYTRPLMKYSSLFLSRSSITGLHGLAQSTLYDATLDLSLAGCGQGIGDRG